MFEYGSGGSTLWFEDSGATVTSVEFDPTWYGALASKVGSRSELLFRPPQPHGSLRSDSAEGFFDDFVQAISRQRQKSFDLVVIDGRCRVACARASVDRVRPGGHLLLDDAHRPKYAAVQAILGDWPRRDVIGIKRGSREVCTTSLWRCPD